jgi:hypothetical protein
MNGSLLRYQCCFCGLEIERVVPDPGALLYRTCLDGPPERQQDQEIYCHSKCLAARLHPSVHLYAAYLAEHGPFDEDETDILPF